MENGEDACTPECTDVVDLLRLILSGIDTQAHNLRAGSSLSVTRCPCSRSVAEVLAAQQAEKIMVSEQLLDSLKLVRALLRCGDGLDTLRRMHSLLQALGSFILNIGDARA